MRPTADHIVLVSASLVGLWAGLADPAVSPVADHAIAAARPAGVVVLADAPRHGARP